MTNPNSNSLDVSSREPGWQKRYLYLIDEELSKPFSWVDSHCVDLMAAAVEACYGPSHPALTDIPRFKTAEETMAELEKRGGLEAILDELFTIIPTTHAFQADIGLLKNEATGEMAGTVVVDGMLVGKHPPTVRASRHVFRLPISLAYKIYRV